jgi:hypothetical protein
MASLLLSTAEAMKSPVRNILNKRAAIPRLAVAPWVAP